MPTTTVSTDGARRVVLDDAASLEDTLAQHYVAHGLPADGGASAPWFRVRVGPVTIRLPNPPARRRAVFFHDINHLLTFVRGRRASSIYERPEDRDMLKAMSVRNIRTLTGIDFADVVATGRDRLSFAGLAVAALLGFFVALGVVVAALLSITQVLTR